jgi:hypothetical protein
VEIFDLDETVAPGPASRETGVAVGLVQQSAR